MLALVAGGFMALTASSARAADRPSNTLQIGLVKSLFRDTPPSLIKVMSRPLKALMDEQTGYSGELQSDRDACELAQAMKDGKVQIGVYHGFEFAWAKQINPDLKPLTICIQQHQQLHAVVMVRKDAEIKDVEELKGKKIGLPQRCREHLHLFLQRRCTEEGIVPAKHFAEVMRPADGEDALEDVIDGVTTAALVDRLVVESFQKEKPERFEQLRPLLGPEIFPAAVIAYQPGAIDEATAARFRDGMMASARTPRGAELLKLCRITSFEPVPADYEQQLADILKAYPPAKR